MIKHTGQIQHDIFTVDYTYRKTAGMKSNHRDIPDDMDDEDVDILKVIMTDQNGNESEVQHDQLPREVRAAIHDTCILEGREYAD